MKKLAIFFPHYPFFDVHLYKDIGLFAKYLSMCHFDEVELLKAGNAGSIEQKTKYFTVKNLFIDSKMYNERWYHTKLFYTKCIIKSFMYLMQNKNITHIMIYHIITCSVFFAFLTKLFSPRIKIYFKTDIDIDAAITFDKSLRKKLLVSLVKRWTFSHIDMISCETTDIFNILSKNIMIKNLHLIPNGFDDEAYAVNATDIISQKENIIITSSRLGSYQKNTELLLDVLSKVELNDWQVVLIGPIESEEQDFQKKIDDFLIKYPGLRTKIIFTGNITDRQLLFNYYGKAKIFFLPSRFESFGIALLEAAAFGDYIISTDVGAARDLTNNGQFGYICPESAQNNQNEEIMKRRFIDQFNSIISKSINIEENTIQQIEYIKNNFFMSQIIKKQVFYDWAE